MLSADRPSIATCSPAPANIAAAGKALEIITKRPDLRTRLWQNTNALYDRLSSLKLNLGPEPTPIIPVRFTDPHEALRVWKGLLAKGVYVNMVLPPATPDGSAFLRCSMSASHTPEQVSAIGDAFEALTAG